MEYLSMYGLGLCYLMGLQCTSQSTDIIILAFRVIWRGALFGRYEKAKVVGGDCSDGGTRAEACAGTKRVESAEELKALQKVVEAARCGEHVIAFIRGPRFAARIVIDGRALPYKQDPGLR